MGLGDPTLLLLLHFSSSLHIRLREHWELYLLLMVTGSQCLSWLLQAAVGAITPNGEYLSQAFVGLWLLVLVPVFSFFDASSTYRHSLVQRNSRRRDSAWWLVVCLFVPTAMYEVFIDTAVTVWQSGDVPMQFVLVGVAGMGGLMLYVHRPLRQAKSVLIISQAFSALGFLVLLLQSGEPSPWASYFPPCVAFMLLALGFLVTLSAMRNLSWGTGKLIQTGYIAVLVARVLSGWGVSLLATWTLEALFSHVLCGLLTSAVLFGLTVSVKGFNTKAK